MISIRLRGLTLAALAVLLLVGCAPQTPPANQLVVNGETVPISLYQVMVSGEQQKLERTGASIDWRSANGRHRLAVIQSLVIRGLVRSLVIEQMASRRGITLDEAALSRSLAGAEQAFGGKSAFEAALQQAGSSQSAFRLVLRYRMLETRLREADGPQFDRALTQALAVARVVITVAPCDVKSSYPACLVDA